MKVGAVQGLFVIVLFLIGPVTIGCSSPDDRAWAQAQREDSLASYRAYLAEFPEGQHETEARSKAAVLEDDLAWEAALREDTLESYESYLAAHKEGRNADTALNRAAAIRDDHAWSLAEAGGTRESYSAYLEAYSKGQHTAEAESRIVDLAWKSATRQNSFAGYSSFLAEFPDNQRYREEANTKLGEITRIHPLSGAGYPQLRIQEQGPTCAGGGTTRTLKAESSVFLSHEVLGKVFGWNRKDSLKIASDPGGLVYVNEQGERVLYGGWCLGNIYLAGPVALPGGGIRLDEGASINFP